MTYRSRDWRPRPQSRIVAVGLIRGEPADAGTRIGVQQVSSMRCASWGLVANSTSSSIPASARR